MSGRPAAGPSPARRPGGHELDAPPWSRVEGTLLSTARSMRRAYDRCLAEAGVHLTEASILAHLGDGGPLTQVELARRIGTSRARIGVHVDGLAEKGAVERRADPADRRVWLVGLTAAGHDLWARTIGIDQAVRRQLRAGTTAAERRQLDDLLVRIERNADAIEAEEVRTDRAAGAAVRRRVERAAIVRAERVRDID